LEDKNKSKEQLIEELAELRGRIAQLEESQARNNAVLRDDSGDIVGTLSSGEDTTRKQAEEALIASKDRLSDAMDLARIVYWEVDLPTGNLIFNDPFYTLYGTSAEREGGYQMTREEYGRRFVHPDDMWIFAQAAEKRRLNKEREFLHDLEYRIVRRDGEVRHILVRVRVSRDAEGHVTKYYGSNQDITARKVAEKALRKSEEQYRRIVDTTTEGIWTLDENFIITYVNKRIAEMLGYEPDELIGKTIMPCIFEEDIPAVLESRERRKQGLSDHFERRYRRKNGTTLWVHISATPIIDEEGRFLGAFAMFTDITDRKQAEEEKEKLQAQLRQSQKMEAIGTLAGGVAHDFNNILTAIMGFTYVLRMDLKSDDPKMAYVDQILSASQKAANLTQSLLAFSRKQQIDLELHKINDIINQITQLLKRLLTEDIELKVSLAHANPTVLADITQIDQILMNLTTNARDAMPKGGTMRIETGIVTLDEEFIALHGYGEPGKYALLSVSDTGTGMNDKTREHIFEPFFTTKEVGKGTGLGLSSVYGIVKQHSGYITVDSTLGKGTTFRIYLPLVHGEEEKKTSLEQGYVQGGNETILVAEDDPAVRMLVTDILHRFGYTTIEAVDGQDALRKFNGSKHIDLIIIDVVMPRMDGKELYEEIKRMNPNIKVLFTSGYTREVVIDKGVEDSMVDFIKKPIEPRELLGKVREVLDKREGERKRGK
jgi:PAS domain S-box-containing protein